MLSDWNKSTNGSTIYHLVVSLNRYIEKGTESEFLSGTLNQLYIYKRVIVNIRNNPSQRFVIIICQIHSLLHIFHVGYVLFLIHLSTESLSARIYIGYIEAFRPKKIRISFYCLSRSPYITSHHTKRPPKRSHYYFDFHKSETLCDIIFEKSISFFVVGTDVSLSPSSIMP